MASGKPELLRALRASVPAGGSHRSFQTGLAELDALAPGGAFRMGAVHELLWSGPTWFPISLALLLARAAGQARAGGAIAWSDPDRELHPPALSAAGIDLQRLLLLRCPSRADQLWAVAECLRCPGVCATVAPLPRLSQIEARRLQLAAERGAGVGLFLRPADPAAGAPYAAASRWLVQPAPGDARTQRWRVQLLHGHGGRTGQVLLLEVDRDTREWRAGPVPVRMPAPLVDRSTATASARATA